MTEEIFKRVSMYTVGFASLIGVASWCFGQSVKTSVGVSIVVFLVCIILSLAASE